MEVSCWAYRGTSRHRQDGNGFYGCGRHWALALVVGLPDCRHCLVPGYQGWGRRLSRWARLPTTTGTSQPHRQDHTQVECLAGSNKPGGGTTNKPRGRLGSITQTYNGLMANYELRHLLLSNFGNFGEYHFTFLWWRHAMGHWMVAQY